MNAESAFPRTVITSLVNRTRNYLASQAGIDVTDARRASMNRDQLELRQSTAIIGIGGNLGILVAFSFPQEMVDVLYDRLTVNIEIPPDDEALYRRETVTEMANVIVGNCTADFSANGERVSMSPPVLLEAAKPIHRMKNAMFESISMVTAYGCFDINLVGPCDMFDAHLNYTQ
jgi:CheY-specific phosphatase CheX